MSNFSCKKRMRKLTAGVMAFSLIFSNLSLNAFAAVDSVDVQEYEDGLVNSYE